MNDSDLKSILRSAHVPERPEEYWEDFPSQVRVQLGRSQPAPTIAPRRTWRPRLAWIGSFAVAALLTFVSVQYQPLKAASLAINQQEKQIRAQIKRFDASLHRLVLNTDGMGYLLAENN